MKKTKIGILAAGALAAANSLAVAFLAANGWLALLWAAFQGAVLFAAFQLKPVEEATIDPSMAIRAELQRLDKAFADFRTLFARIAPLWSRHLVLVRGQIREAIENLAQRFGSLSSRLNASGTASGEDNLALRTIAGAETGLKQIMDSLNQTQEFRLALLDQITGIARHSADLKRMADKVTTIATQSNLLAINASIEAARSGEHGRGFGIVADEMQKLANASAESGRQIHQIIETVAGTISDALGQAEDFSRRESAMVKGSAELAARIVAEFQSSAQALQARVADLHEERLSIDRDIQDVLVNLQFQDRVDQIIGHVLEDLDRAAVATSAPDAAAPDIDGWLARLSASYTTHEQRNIHIAGADRQASRAPAETTFF